MEEYSDQHKKRKVEELKDEVNDITDSQFEVTVQNKDTGSSENISTNAELPVAKVSTIPQSEDHVKVLLVQIKSSIP